MTTFDALLFDMDGLLLDTERLAQSVFEEITGPHGVTQREAEAFFLTLVGTSSADTRARVDAFIPEIDIETFDHDWSQGIRAKVAEAVPLMLGVKPVLAALADQGHRMAVVTSTSTEHAIENLERAGLIDFFAQVTGGDMVSANKPDPAPYLETAAALGVKAERCAAFEDSDRGLTAAVRAGCRAVQIPDLRPPGQPFPDLGQHIAPDLHAAMVHLGLLS